MIAGILVITLVVAVVGIGYWAWRTRRAISDAYMLEWVSIMVAEHIKSTGKLPANWTELKDEYEQLPNLVGEIAIPLAELQQNIDVVFSLNIEEVANRERHDLHYLRLKSGQGAGLSNPSPNGRIWDQVNKMLPPN